MATEEQEEEEDEEEEEEWEEEEVPDNSVLQNQGMYFKRRISLPFK